MAKYTSEISTAGLIILSQQPISAYAFNNLTLWLIWLNNRLDHFKWDFIKKQHVKK